MDYTYDTVTDLAWAGKFLKQWCRRAMRSQIEPMKAMVRTLRNPRQLMLNWFRARGEISNGSLEGMNEAMLARRKAFGFKSDQAIEIVLYCLPGKLPEPIQTHRFC